MPPGAGMFYFLGVLLIELPIAAVRTILRLLFFVLRRVFAVFRLRQFWRAVPLDRKCQFRATVGAFVLVVLGGGILCDAIPCTNWPEVWARPLAGFALLSAGGPVLRPLALRSDGDFLVGRARSLVRRAALLRRGVRNDRAGGSCCGGRAARGVAAGRVDRAAGQTRCAARSAQYGHPMAGFASVRDAHAALTRQGATARPQFTD